MYQNKKLELIEDILLSCAIHYKPPKIGDYIERPIWQNNLDLIKDLSDKDFKNIRPDYIKKFIA